MLYSCTIERLGIQFTFCLSVCLRTADFLMKISPFYFLKIQEINASKILRKCANSRLLKPQITPLMSHVYFVWIPMREYPSSCTLQLRVQPFLDIEQAPTRGTFMTSTSVSFYCRQSNQKVACFEVSNDANFQPLYFQFHG